MSLTATVSAGAAEEYKKSQSAFEAIPAGNYEVTVKAAEVVDFSKKPEYRGKNALNVQLRIVDHAPAHAGRIFFLRVPLFDKFAPTAKYPDGAPAFGYFQFFDAVGVSEEDVAAGRLPDIRDILGRQLSARISLEQPNEYHDETWNDVKGVKKSSGLAAVATSAPASNPWAPDAADAAFAQGAWTPQSA